MTWTLWTVAPIGDIVKLLMIHLLDDPDA